MPIETEAPEAATDGMLVLRDLVGACTLLLVAQAAEPLFFGDGFYGTVAIHPFWIVVILASVQSGFFVGVTTAMVAAVLMDWPARPTGVDITAYYLELALVPVQWLLAAVVLGGFRQGQIRREAWLLAENCRLRAMGEDLAAEVQRMDSAVAALELQAATAQAGPERPPTTVAGAGEVEAKNPSAELAALAKAVGPQALVATFTEAAAALGFAGALFHRSGVDPVGVGSAPRLSVVKAERLHRLLSRVPVVETETSGGRAVLVVPVGDQGFVATVTSRWASDLPREGTDAEEAMGAPAASRTEAVARTMALAAALQTSAPSWAPDSALIVENSEPGSA